MITYYLHEHHLVIARVCPHEPGVSNGVGEVLHCDLHPRLGHIDQVVREELVDGVNGKGCHVSSHVLRPRKTE